MDAKPLSFILRISPQADGWSYELRCVQEEESQSFEHLEEVLHYLRGLQEQESQRRKQ